MSYRQIELPSVSSREALNEVWVDSTPDGGYALRLLRAYRWRCDCRFVITGTGSEETAPLFEQMNRDQEKRARELDLAISILEAAAAAPSPTEPVGEA